MIVYDEKDIVRSYTEAKNKKLQVKILAELNATDPEEIIGVLQRNGVMASDKPKNNDVVVEVKDETKKAIPLAVIEAITIHKKQLEKDKKIMESQINELDRFLKSVVCE
ncbi:MAG: hypothetical protein Q4B86_07290 [Eubacteriales bacterium]|nr:hypothetical protein [Eubacteriales bacterium]